MDYTKIYNEAKTSAEKLYPGFINKHRAIAFETVAQIGFPNKKTEKYKYTPLDEVFNKEFSTVNPFELKESNVDLPIIDALKIYTVNGVYFGSEHLKHEEGFTFGSMAAATKEAAGVVEKHYNTLADNTDVPTAMNTATALNGLFVSVKPGVETAKPLMIINITDTEIPVYTQQRNLFVFGENCIAEVIIFNVEKSAVPTLANDVSEIIIEKNAQVEIVRIHNKGNQSQQVTSEYNRQFADSTLNYTNVILGGSLVRQNTEIHLAEQHCYNNLYGLVISSDEQHTDSYTFIDHAVPECQSNELYKSILDDKAVNVFNGRILVRQDAQKTLAFQSNRNILLNTGAKMYTKPQLEIYADDVKCSHGATIGQLNEDALYYMQSRGISKKTAELLLMSGFANEALGKISNKVLYEYLVGEVEKTLTK